jgi:hypothetical protein
MPRKNILALLEGGDRRTIGRSNQVAELVSADPMLFPALIAGLSSADPLVCMRAADAAEKVTQTHPDLLQPHTGNRKRKTEKIKQWKKVRQLKLRR